MTDDDRKIYNESIHCPLCFTIYYERGMNTSKEEDDENDGNIKVIHHDHYTGKFISPVCKSCNSKMKDKKVLSIIFHNFTGFDSKMFFKQLCKDEDFYIKIIPRPAEIFLSFSAYLKIKTGKQVIEKFMIII